MNEINGTQLSNRRSMAGLSLVEMMVVIAIIGVVAGIAVPNSLSFMRTAKIASQSDVFVSSLVLARQEAIRLRKNVSVCAASDPSTSTACSTTASDWSKGWIILPNGSTTPIKRVVLPGNVSLVIPATETGGIVFRATLGSVVPGTGSQVCTVVDLTDPSSGSRANGASGWPAPHRVDIYPAGKVVKLINQSCPS